jgi:glycerol uptake operon antiterminator
MEAKNEEFIHMRHIFQNELEASPVIAAVKSEEGLNTCLKSECRIVFILFGDICTIPEIVSRIKAAGKLAFVHVDLINGLASRDIAADFIRKYTEADGIISTKPTILHRAGELGLLTVLRVFLIDSMAYENLKKQVSAAKPDVVEVLPGMMPKVIGTICRSLPVPVIAGGMIRDKEDILALLKEEVTAVSSTNKDMWFV